MAHVLPEFSSQHGFMRARACWVARHYCEIEWSNPAHRQQLVQKVLQGLGDQNWE